MHRKMLSYFVALAVAMGVSLAHAETYTATNVVVAPLTDAHWTQNSPYNDYSPKGTTVFTSGWEAGCVATAAAQELYYWQWPWRLDAVHETSHPVLNESNLALRFDGNVPFDWESMQGSYGDGATLKQKHAAARLVLACQSLVRMRFVSGGGEAMRNLPGTMDWFEYAGQVTPRESDANLAALREDFEWGSPVQTGINFKGYGGHEVVGLGYATGTNSVGDAKNLIWLNLGWGGGSDGWYDIGETDSSETIIKSVQLGFRPIKSVQIEPIAPVSGSSVTLNWHLPNCYTNKISGFSVAKKMPSASTTTWTDDFSTGGKGRSSNTNEMRVANGGLMAWDGTASAIYTWDEALLLSSDSILTYDIGSSYMSGMEVRFEARFGNGGWQKIGDISLNSGRTSYYDNNGAESTMTSGVVINLGQYAGKMAQFRVAVEYTTGGTFANYWASMKIDNLSISNVKTFETVSTDSTIAASARSTTFSGLTTGETYAFTVTPVMSDNSAAVTQTATTTIGTPAAAPTINSVTMSPKGSNLVQEGFYADIAMGWNIIDVACSESVTTLEAFISHQSVLPQSKIEVVDNGSGNFSINIDATEVAAKWANQKMILTLKATNATGESAYKDVELCLKASGVPENIPGGKVWTGASAMFGAENYTAKWSGNVLPTDGDKVTFKTTDAEFGGEMNLNLSTPTALGYVYATGDGQLTISGASSETLTANVLKNDIQVEINSSKFKVNKAIPSANIVIDSGSCLDCEIDQSRSGWIKKATYGYPSALTDSSLWNGTVVFSGYSADWLNPSSYGNTSSKVRFNGVAGYLAHSNPTFNPTIELVDNGSTPAFDWNNGSSASTATFKGISGDGTFKTSGSSATSERIVINDIGSFTGSFNLASKVVTIGTTKGTDASNGRLNFNSGYGATIAGGKTWTIGGGVYLAGNQTLTVNGALSDSGALSADGTGTVLSLAPTATVTAASLSFANNTIRLAKTAEASPTFSVTGAAILTNATIEVTLADGMSAGDSIALMSAGSFEGIDSATLEGLDGYSLEVSGGTLYAVKGITPTPEATPLEESEGFVTGDYQLAFTNASLSQLTAATLGGKFSGGWVENKGKDATFCNFVTVNASKMTCEAQIDGEYDGTTPIIKAICLEFAQVDDDIYVKVTEVKWKANSTLGEALTPVYNTGTLATTADANGYAFYNLTLDRSGESAYEGPAPIAVWVAGEFDDDKSAHGGLEFALNGNTIDENGNIVIGNSTTLGATVAVPSGTLPRMTMLVKYSVPAGGAPVAQSAPASLFSTYDMGALAGASSSALAGYWLNGSTVSTGSYAFSNPAQTMPQEGYILVSNWTKTPNDSGHGTAVYSGETLSALVGGEVTGLRFTGDNNYITAIGVGGPTVAGTKPWQNMVIKSVALFDEWVATNVIANYKFPVQGAVKPEDSDRYVVEPVASWVNDFKTTEKNGCTLSVSGTTAAKDDSFGGTLTIGNASALIDTTAAATSNMTVLIKYRAASNVTNAPVVAFGAPATYGLDVGVYAKLDKTLAVYRNFSTDNGKPYNFSADPVLSATGGYVLCARDSGQKCMAYVGDSLDAMTGEELSSTNIKFSNLPVKALGIGGNSSFPANANDMVPFTGFVIEKIVIFSGYYTPDQIRYVPNPEDGDTVNISDNTTWTFTASDTPREYTSVGTLSSSGTIAIANASELTEGTYPLATWSTPQQYTTQCAGYGKVGTLVTEGLAEGLSARLVYGARGIYLRVDDTAKQAARKPLVVWCYGDSITEGFNAQATGANYRILLYQKLEMLGYNVRSTGVYGLSNGYNSVDPTGTPLTDQYKWHSAKHGATAGPTTLAHRSNLSENVDTLAIQAGTPDVALLLIGVNDIPEWKNEADRVTPVFKAWTNVVSRMVKNLPDTKIVVSTILYSDGTRTDIDPTITAVNTQIKNLIDNLPAEWQGHVVLADLNSYVKSGETGIIYNDHLHPDWWGYDQMADGYLDAIVKCYPDPDATDFPSQNPIPAAPTSDQLGAANKPELAAYRAGFTKLCNIRVEKGQDVSNVVYDDVNGDAASDNLEKVGYFVEFVRADNHAHKWVWVDMDAFGDADLASVGLPQRNYQQAVTRMHVCSNHGAIDNVAADDDTVTGWIEFSPYNYDRAGSNSAAPANYGEPFDWNDTLSESGSYGCMQVFRVMNPSSRDLFERPQLMFAFNNFQSQNSNPADFGIGNFAQHFNCNNSYHTEDWTGVGGTLAKMAPDQYSVKTIEIWTKDYSGPKPDAVWVAGEFNDDKRVHGGCEFALNGNATNSVGEIVIGNAATLGATATLPAATYQKLTMLVQYSLPSGGAPAANSVPASMFSQHDLGALAASGSSALTGYWLNGSTISTGNYAFSSPDQTIPQDGYILISTWATNTNPDDHGTAFYTGENLSSLSGGEKTGLRFTGAHYYITSVGVGGPTVAGAVPWAGMVIKNVAIFGDWVTPEDIAGYKFPKKGAVQPEDADTLMIVDGMTWNFAAGTTRTYTNVGKLSTGGTIAITNASELVEGFYTLATWTMAQKLSKGYGHVGTLDVTGLPAGLSAELVYGAKAIYLRVWNPTTQAARGTIKVWPYGDSITEGFNSSGTTANYRVLLAQKLSMLGYNVEMVGCYDKVNGANAINPAGQSVPDKWKWHSAKHGATAGPTTNYNRGNLCENVDTLAAQAGNPDVVLLHIGVNDLAESSQDENTTFNSLTNVVQHLIDDLPNSKIVVSTALRQLEPARAGHNVEIDAYNELIRKHMADIPAAWSGHVLFADLATFVDSQDYGIICTDNVHPDWWGHDQMAEGWLSVVTNQFMATQVFPSATVPAAPTADELGAAAKMELDAYRQGFKLARRIDAASNLNTSNPYAVTGDGATENIEKVGYFVEYVRADNNAHKWVWVDMDAFGTTIDDVGLPTADHQQVVTKLHVKSNHNGIEDVAANDDSVSGFVEFSCHDYSGIVSGRPGAPTGNSSSCDWNDKLLDSNNVNSGSNACMQVHRISPSSGRGGQVLFAYNNWQSDTLTAEFGIGNCSQHFYTTGAQPCTFDYTFTRTFPKLNADAYSVKRIEIWTKEKATDTDFPTPYSWIDMYFPELVSGWSSTEYNDFATNKGHGSVKNGYAPWESYVLGLDPTNETSKLTVSIRMDGETPIVEYSPTNEVLKASGDISYILLGKPALSNDWQEVEFDEPGETNRFFRVKVEWEQ